MEIDVKLLPEGLYNNILSKTRKDLFLFPFYGLNLVAMIMIIDHGKLNYPVLLFFAIGFFIGTFLHFLLRPHALVYGYSIDEDSATFYTLSITGLKKEWTIPLNQILEVSTKRKGFWRFYDKLFLTIHLGDNLDLYIVEKNTCEVLAYKIKEKMQTINI